MSYNLVNPTTGALTRVSGNITSNIIPANASSSNKLVAKSDIIIKHNYSMAGTASLEDDIKTFVTALIALGANTYAGFFNRSGNLGTAGNYSITVYAEEGTSTFASGYIALGAGAMGKTQYMVSYYKPAGSSEEWNIKKLVTVSTPQNGLITITSVSGANANATTTYTNVGVGDLVNVVIDSGVQFIPSWWGTVSGLSSLGITNIQNIQGISGECRILARVCESGGSVYLDLLRDTTVDTVADGNMNPVTSNAVAKYGIRFDTSAASAVPDIANTFIKFRKNENIITMDIQDSSHTGVSIDFDYRNGFIRLYSMTNGSVSDTWTFGHM